MASTSMGSGASSPTADAVMRRVLRIPEAARDAPRGGEALLGASVALSALRCITTYVILPLAGPLLQVGTELGPLLDGGLAGISLVAVVAAARRFWLVDHPWRWRYSAVGAALVVWLGMGLVRDVQALTG